MSKGKKKAIGKINPPPVMVIDLCELLSVGISVN
jgi:hypothetical protein